MNKLTLFVSFVVFLSVDLLPLNEVTKQLHHLVKRSENSSQISPPGNSSTSCNSTAGGCNNSTLINSTNSENFTNSFNATKIHLNLTEVCHPNGTALKVMCNGTLLNLTEHCNNVTVDNISLYCINGSIASNVTILPGSNASVVMQNVTALNSSTTNNTSINTTITALNVIVSISTTQTAGVAMSLTPTPSLSSITASSSSQVSAVTEASSSSVVHPSSSSVTLASSSVGVTNSPTAAATTSHEATPQATTTTLPTTPQTTTSTTIPPTPQSTSTKPTTHEPTTSQTTKLPSTPHDEEKTTASERTTETVETEVINHKTTETKTEKSSAVTTMQSPYDSAKNIKFFYVNVLIPVGVGVCGALLIAFSVILFKCCRRKKLKKVRYFGKPRGGYTRNNMDHMNLLAHSSDEE